MLLEHGQLDEARAWAERLVSAGTAREQPLEQAHGRWALAEVLRCAGDLDAANNEIHAALQLLGMISPLDVPGAQATLAALRLAQGRTAEALAAAAEGLARYEAMGTCSQFFRGAFLRLVHVDCLAAAGQHDAARAALATAAERILANAAKIQDPGYRKSFLENVPENRRTLALAKQSPGKHA